LDTIEKFVSYLSHEKRFSQHTILAYTNDLQQFRDFLSFQYQIEQPVEASHFMVRSWIVSLMEKDYDARSVNRKMTTLRSYYNFLVRTGQMERSPMRKVIAPKTRKKLPEYLDSTRMEQLFRLMEEGEEGFESLRNHLLIDMLYRTGIRRAELIGLKLSDVNMYNLTITVLGKRNKVRQIPITSSFAEILKNYVNLRSEFMIQKCTSHDWFFIDNSGNQMYPGFVYRIVKAGVSKVSTGQKRSPHILRHSFATALLNEGADINAIKELLGHSSLAATQVYTHNSIEKLKEIYKQAFPKA
jgi:integrase/recombinase XerC